MRRKQLSNLKLMQHNFITKVSECVFASVVYIVSSFVCITKDKFPHVFFVETILL